MKRRLPDTLKDAAPLCGGARVNVSHRRAQA
jgi:hypothetical protein